MIRKHYPILIAAAAFLCLGVVNGQLLNCYSLLVVPICEELAIPRAQMQLSQTLMGIGNILVPLLAGRIYSRLRFKRITEIAAVLTVLFYFSLSIDRNTPMIYISAIGLSISSSFISWMPFSIIINNWFEEKRGTAIGVTFMSSGVFGMVFNVLGGIMIEGMGWRGMIRVNTAVAACVILPLVFFVIYEKPFDIGLLPYGHVDDAPEASVSPEAAGALFSDEIRRLRLPLILLAVMLFGFGTNSITSSFCAYMRDNGRSTTAAANLYAGYMASLAVGKIILGSLYDRLGQKKATFISLMSLLLADLALVLIRVPGALAVVIVFSGIGAASSSVSLPEIAKRTFGARDYNRFAGAITGLNSIGGCAAPLIFGMIRDGSGSYMPGYLAAAVMTGAAVTILTLVTKDGEKA